MGVSSTWPYGCLLMSVRCSQVHRLFMVLDVVVIGSGTLASSLRASHTPQYGTALVVEPGACGHCAGLAKRTLNLGCTGT